MEHYEKKISFLGENIQTIRKHRGMKQQELADFETVLKKDLAKAGNEKRFAKDKKFWDDQLNALGEPLYSDKMCIRDSHSSVFSYGLYILS